jgi:Fungal specific transcription factor domain
MKIELTCNEDQLLPMAQAHRGLMHSLLSLSGTHLIIKEESVARDGRIEAKAASHFDKALTLLQTDENMNKRIKGEQDVRIQAPTVAQVVVLCLQTVCEGDTSGVHMSHLSALKSMLEGDIDTTEDEYLQFLSEFLIYHDMSASITSKRQTLIMSDSFQIPSFIAEGAKNFLGVCNGLFGSTKKTRQLRDRVRRRRDEQQRPYVDFNTIMDGKSIDSDLKATTCSYEVGSDEWIAWNLYKTTFWLYLHRTLNNSTSSPELENGVRQAIEYLQSIPPDSSVQSVLLTPIFIVACAAFNENQRPAINEAFDVLERFSSLGNIKHARQVVDRVWTFMDAGNDRSWDWEGIMEEMVSMVRFGV